MRKLATIRLIDDITPIDGADTIQVATVGGWKVVVRKGEYKIGDRAVYCEIDSFIPSAIAPFLTKAGQYPKLFNGVEGERLKTIKLKGQLSQGLLLPLSCHPLMADRMIGDDVSELLNIQKWEAPLPPQLGGQIYGVFPSLVPKTDQERIQNIKDEFEDYKNRLLHFEMTEKLDGSSCTFYLSVDGVFEVCSRNLSLKEATTNSFWKVALRYQVRERMELAGLRGVAIQGELIGEGIQKNRYCIRGQDFFVFDIYDAKEGKYVTGSRRREISATLGLKHVPVISEMGIIHAETTIDDLLVDAEGKSALNPKTEREGIVFKCVEDPAISFKAISNKFLLKGGE